MGVRVTDPVERVITDALTAAGVQWRFGVANGELDILLTSFGVWIECKRFHSPRIAEQMSRHPNVIAVQGMPAALALANMLTSSGAALGSVSGNRHD